MRELNINEIKAVNGGIAPLIGLAVAIAGHATARTLGAWVLSRIGTVTAVYSVAEYFGGGGGKTKLIRVARARATK